MRVNGTEMYLRSFKICMPVIIPASAKGKLDYFRIARENESVQDGRHICTSKIESSSSAEFPRPRPVQALPRGVYCK